MVSKLYCEILPQIVRDGFLDSFLTILYRLGTNGHSSSQGLYVQYFNYCLYLFHHIGKRIHS